MDSSVSLTKTWTKFGEGKTRKNYIYLGNTPQRFVSWLQALALVTAFPSSTIQRKSVDLVQQQSYLLTSQTWLQSE